MYHTQDLEAIQRITGFQSEEEVYAIPGLEDEYKMQLRMYHRAVASDRGQPLPPHMLIPLLRQFKFRLPIEREQAKTAKPKPVDWQKVPEGTQVIVEVMVNKNGKNVPEKQLGKFQGLIERNVAAVKHGANPWIEQYLTSKLSLAPKAIPDDVVLAGADYVTTPQDLQEEAEYEAEVEAESLDERKDPADTTKVEPIIKLPAFWYNVDPMTEVEGEHASQVFQGHFVDVGPRDGYITCLVHKDNPAKQRTIVVRATKVKKGWTADFTDLADQFDDEPVLSEEEVEA